MKFIYTLLILFSAFVSIVPSSAQTTFWTKKAGPYGGSVTDVEFDPARNMAYAVIENRYFYSTDDGTSWQRNSIVSSIYDIEIGDNGTVYLTDGFAIYRSTNGIDFTQVTTNFVLSGGYKIRRISNGPSGTIVALSSSKLYFSTDDGVTFTAGATGSFKTSFFAVGPGVSGGQGVYFLENSTSMPRRSTNGGVSVETPTNTNLTGPVYSISSRNDKAQIFAVNATGIFSATNGDTWTSIKGGSITDANIASSTDFSFIEFSADGTGMYFIDNLNDKIHYKALTGTAWVQSANFPGGAGNNIFGASAKTLSAASPGSSIALFGNSKGLIKTTTGTSSFVSNANIGIEMADPKQVISSSNGNLLVNSYNLGLQYSTDRGLNWQRSATTPPGTIDIMTGVSSVSTRNHDILVLNTSNAVYRTTTGSSYTSVTTPTTFRWIQGTGFDRVFALSTAAAPAFYYSYNSGQNWTASPITITGLPTSFSISNTFKQMSVYSLTSTSAVMFFQLFSNTPATGTEYWKITFTIGTTTTISGVAAKVTPHASFTGIIPDLAFATNGKFYMFTDSPNPDFLAYSANAGSSWTPINAPGNNGQMFVADNGYLFFVSNLGKVFFSRDDGATFDETSLPAGTTISSPFNITDMHVDTRDFAQMLLYRGSLHSSGKAIALPASPTGAIVLAKTSSSVSIAWNDNAYNETYYRIERSSNGGTNWTFAGDVSGTDICAAPSSRGYFVDKGLSPSTAYLYRVTAANAAGSSTTSATTASTTTLATTTPSIPDGRSWSGTSIGGNGYTAVTVPKTPIGIRHLGGGLYQISDVSLGSFTSSAYPETFYESNGVTMLVGSNNSSTIRTNGLGTWNGVNVLTLKWKKCSEDKFETITLTLNGVDPTPDPPTGLQALVNGTNSIEVTWNGGFYVKDYIVERSPNGTSGFVQVGSNVTTNKLVDPGPFTEGTAYHYRVRARNITNVQSTNSDVYAATYRKPTFVLSNAAGLANINTVTLGMYAGDFNNDGWEDLFSIQNSLQNNSTSQPIIFANQGDGTFNPIQPTFAVEPYLLASVTDANNDGKLDIGLSAQSTTRFDFYYGNGDFTFTRATEEQLGELASISIVPASHSWADFNADGRLDVILVGNGDILLFKQKSDGTFTRVPGGDIALDTDSETNALWADYDSDGDADVLITDQNDAWRLYQNNGDETFTNKTGPAGLSATEGISGPWGDYNNDGKLDLFVGDSDENALYRNNGDGTFTKEGTTSVSAAVTSFANAWGDFNNDGLLDLVTPTIPILSATSTRLFMNTTTGVNPSFQLITTEKINDGFVGHYGAAAIDFDKNGFLDFMPSSLGITDAFGPTNQTLFVNNNTTGNWIQVKLIGIISNKLGVGGQVTVVANGKTYYREVASNSSFASQSSFTQHIGIGAATSITSLKVKWPSGIIQTLTNPTINQILTITEDGVGPVASSYSPANDATSVNNHTALEITFNETPVPVAGKKLTITASGDAAATYTIDMAAATVNGDKLNFTLPGRLLGNKRYDLALEAGAVNDIYQNASLASGWGFTTAATPAVSALIPANGAIDIAINSILEINFDKSITAVAGKKIKVTGPTTPFEVDVTTGTVAGSKFTINPPTGGWPYLTQLTVTLDAGAFADENGNDTEAISGTAWSFKTIISPDATPPSFDDVSKLPATTEKAALVSSLSVGISDNRGVTGATVFFKPASSGTFTQNAGTSTTGTAWTFTLPPAAFDATGAQYYFTATDAAGNTARTPATGTYQTLIKYKSSESQIPAILLGSGGQANGWKVIAIPFDLGINNGVATVFDELPAGGVKVDWRLLSLSPEPKQWLDYPDGFSTINRGVGYFINIKTPPAILIGDNLTAPNNTRENLFKMNLKKGWNMVGNPYLEPIDWANVVSLNSITGTGAVFKKFGGGSYSNSGTLAAYEGGFVQVPADITVSIPFLGQITGSRVGQPDFGSDEWLLPIVLKQGELTNTFGGVGMHSKASSSFDAFDDINGPRWFEFTEMNFKHPEHFSKEFARDVVPIASEYVWEFTVDSNLPDAGILTWDAHSYSIEKDIYLYDVATQTPVNIKENNSYSFDPQVSRTFKIFYGDNALARIKPARVTLGAAYPNPASKATTIPFTVPDQKGNMKVRLEVFDMTGKVVNTLANGEFTPGFYRSEWQPQEGQSDGLYFYRLSAGNDVLTGKVVLKK